MFRVRNNRLELEDSAVSVQGNETRARGIVAWRETRGIELYTVGHTLSDKQMIGQLLDWAPLLKWKVDP
jgi:hypothetical protein